MRGSFLIGFLLVWLFPAAAVAAPFTFTAFGVDDEDPEHLTDLAAQVVFENIGGNLVITLSNISSADVLKTSSVLTGLFFDIAGSPTLTPLSAVVGSSSNLVTGSTIVAGPGANVGDFWAYESTTDPPSDDLFPGGPRGTNYGIGAAAVGDLFSTGNFDGADGATVNGVDYGILPTADDPTTPMGGGPNNLNNSPLVKSSMVFTLSGVGLAFDPSVSIFNVNFQYGSSPDEPNIVPEPGTLWLFGSGLALLARHRLRHKRRTPHSRRSDL